MALSHNQLIKEMHHHADVHHTINNLLDRVSRPDVEIIGIKQNGKKIEFVNPLEFKKIRFGNYQHQPKAATGPNKDIRDFMKKSK